MYHLLKNGSKTIVMTLVDHPKVYTCMTNMYLDQNFGLAWIGSNRNRKGYKRINGKGQFGPLSSPAQPSNEAHAATLADHSLTGPVCMVPFPPLAFPAALAAEDGCGSGWSPSCVVSGSDTKRPRGGDHDSAIGISVDCGEVEMEEDEYGDEVVRRCWEIHQKNWREMMADVDATWSFDAESTYSSLTIPLADPRLSIRIGCGILPDHAGTFRALFAEQ